MLTTPPRCGGAACMKMPCGEIWPASDTGTGMPGFNFSPFGGPNSFPFFGGGGMNGNQFSSASGFRSVKNTPGCVPQVTSAIEDFFAAVLGDG